MELSASTVNLTGPAIQILAFECLKVFHGGKCRSSLASVLIFQKPLCMTKKTVAFDGEIAQNNNILSEESGDNTSRQHRDTLHMTWKGSLLPKHSPIANSLFASPCLRICENHGCTPQQIFDREVLGVGWGSHHLWETDMETYASTRRLSGMRRCHWDSLIYFLERFMIAFRSNSRQQHGVYLARGFHVGGKWAWTRTIKFFVYILT